MIKNKQFLASVAFFSVVALALMFGIGSAVPGPWPFPPDDNGGNLTAGSIVPGPWPFPPDDNGGNIIAGSVVPGPWPFPPDDNGGNIIA